MSNGNRVAWLALSLLVSASVFAEQITGTVTNGTTNKPAAGEQVVLLSLASGMNEVAHGSSDSQGRFTINVPDPGVQHLLRVTYQSVNYFQSVAPGTAAADITIYNSAKEVAGIFEDARVYTLQAERGQLEVSVTYTLQNESQPPRTKMDTETFEVELPPGAQLVDASAAGPSGMPLPTSPVPTGKNNRYALVFPIRPGKAQFHVSYTVPYSGSFEFGFTPDSSLSELGVLLPKSMQFKGVSRSFAQDSDEAGLAVFFAKNVPAHELVKFSVSGEGVAPREAQAGEAQQSPPGAGGAPAQTSGAGSNTLWYVAGVMVIIVAGGGFWLWRKSAAAAPRGSATVRTAKSQANTARRSAPAAPAMTAQDSMLETLKDELFQLETDRLNGKVSDDEYQKSKAGLDALLRRQLKKTGGQQKS